jgi:hypothetical protein
MGIFVWLIKDKIKIKLWIVPKEIWCNLLLWVGYMVGYIDFQE